MKREYFSPDIFLISVTEPDVLTSSTLSNSVSGVGDIYNCNEW